VESAAAQLTVVLATLLTVAACVVLQYEALIYLWRRLAAHGGHRRVKVLHAVASLMLLHGVEIAIFGVVLRLLTLWPACGSLHGEPSTDLLDYLYFSGATFSTVGFGELWPVGPIRFLAATEALAGLVLITWSASFTYLEMEKAWGGRS
jgi:hypothetical protein